MVQGSILTFEGSTSCQHSQALREAGWNVVCAKGANALDSLLSEMDYDAVLIHGGLNLPEAIDVAVNCTAADAELPIIAVIEGLSPELEDVLSARVFDCVPADGSPRHLVRSLEHARAVRQLVRQNRVLHEQVGNRKSRPRAVEDDAPTDAELIGESGVMQAVRARIAEVAPTDVTVIIEGESGTGKDIVARTIHACSPRANAGVLVKINCPAIPEQLLESELFGHEAGAFTGANKRKPGRLEAGAGGTSFLDEISLMPLSVQAKLLQALEHKQFTRLGGNTTIGVDTRIIVATNVSLTSMIRVGKFRADLYFRLNQFTVHMPPLRNRAEDIPLLVEHFLNRYAPTYGNDGLTISSRTMAQLMSWHWPGNVRELESSVRRFALTGREDGFFSNDGADENWQVGDQLETVRQSERRTIIAALTQTQWNRRRAARMLGISYNTLRRRIAQYSLDKAPRLAPSGFNILK